jgi:hypothetical protein
VLFASAGQALLAPVQVSATGGDVYVDWAYFGARRLTGPFFEDAIRRALALPFNALFRYRMTMRDFAGNSDVAHSLAPAGFIFHMSRCGSTLVAQMLAALPDAIVLAEAAPLDMIVQLARAWPDMPESDHVRMLTAMVAAYGRRRSADTRRYIIKLDSWHTLALPLFRRAFPSVPWVFLYRDPVEVMVSQMRQRGIQTVPTLMPPALYAIDGAATMRGEEYCARVLAKTCCAALAHLTNGGLPVNYRELPDAVFSRILPHFGMTIGADEETAMRHAARYDAKAPAFEFSDDSASKQRGASELVRALAARHLGPVYRELEAHPER